MVFQHADSGPHMVAVAEAQLLAPGRSPHGGHTPANPMVLPPLFPDSRSNDCMGWQMPEPWSGVVNQ